MLVLIERGFKLSFFHFDEDERWIGGIWELWGENILNASKRVCVSWSNVFF
jgi:hypothetical protein